MIMTSIGKTLFCLIIVQLLIFELSFGEEKEDMVCVKYSDIKVAVAFLVEDYIFLLGEAKKDGNLVADSERMCIRVFHTMKPDPSAKEDTTSYYEAKTCNHISVQIDHYNRMLMKGTIRYAFSTKGMTQIFDKVKYPNEDKATQTQSHMHYFVKPMKDPTQFEIHAYEIEGYKPDEEKEPSFNILNNRTVYQSTEPDYDETELLNVKLLMYHFPKGVDIKSIVIMEESKFESTKKSQNYLALVYTTETVNGQPFHVRHYLRGKPKPYEFNGESFDRLVWEVDESFNNQTGLGACSHLKDMPTAVTLSYSEQIGTNTMSFHILEFFGTLYKAIRIDILPKGNATLIDNMGEKLDKTSNFIKCGRHPISEKLPVSDCRQNKAFNKPLKEADELPSLDVNGSGDSSQSFWIVFGILLGIVAIIGLVGYEIYSLNDLASNQSK